MEKGDLILVNREEYEEVLKLRQMVKEDLEEIEKMRKGFKVEKTELVDRDGIHFEREEGVDWKGRNYEREMHDYDKTIHNIVRLAQLRGPEVANSTYLEALRTVIEFARPLTLDETCSITGWIPKTVSNRISEIKKGKQKQEYRGVPFFKRGGGPLFRIEDILRYMGAFEPDPLHSQVLEKLALQGKDAKE